jgi:hypothetical protein
MNFLIILMLTSQAPRPVWQEPLVLEEQRALQPQNLALLLSTGLLALHNPNSNNSERQSDEDEPEDNDSSSYEG